MAAPKLGRSRYPYIVIRSSTVTRMTIRLSPKVYFMMTTTFTKAQAFGKPEGTMVRMTCFRVTPVETEFQIAEMVKPNEEIEELLWITSDFDRAKLTVTGIMILEDLKAKDLID